MDPLIVSSIPYVIVAIGIAFLIDNLIIYLLSLLLTTVGFLYLFSIFTSDDGWGVLLLILVLVPPVVCASIVSKIIIFMKDRRRKRQITIDSEPEITEINPRALKKDLFSIGAMSFLLGVAVAIISSLFIFRRITSFSSGTPNSLFVIGTLFTIILVIIPVLLGTGLIINYWKKHIISNPDQLKGNHALWAIRFIAILPVVLVVISNVSSVNSGRQVLQRRVQEGSAPVQNPSNFNINATSSQVLATGTGALSSPVMDNNHIAWWQQAKGGSQSLNFMVADLHTGTIHPIPFMAFGNNDPIGNWGSDETPYLIGNSAFVVSEGNIHVFDLKNLIVRVLTTQETPSPPSHWEKNSILKFNQSWIVSGRTWNTDYPPTLLITSLKDGSQQDFATTTTSNEQLQLLGLHDDYAILTNINASKDQYYSL